MFYLPYLVHAQAGSVTMVVVQLSDEVQGCGHDPKKFHVIEAMVLDQQGRIIKEINPR